MAKRARITDILTLASQLSGVPVEDITGPNRAKRFVRIRQAIAAVARMQRPEHSYPEIARRMKRDHSSIVNQFQGVLDYADAGRDMLIAKLTCAADETAVFFTMDRRPAPLMRIAKQRPKPKRPPPPTRADIDEAVGIAFIDMMDDGSARFLAALRAAG